MFLPKNIHSNKISKCQKLHKIIIANNDINLDLKQFANLSQVMICSSCCPKNYYESYFSHYDCSYYNVDCDCVNIGLVNCDKYCSDLFSTYYV